MFLSSIYIDIFLYYIKSNSVISSNSDNLKYNSLAILCLLISTYSTITVIDLFLKLLKLNILLIIASDFSVSSNDLRGGHNTFLPIKK